ncbi:MAG TPA: DUF2165 domain-containing protein [Chitinophagaceae bacterium]|nr:DUF2165 domain-containing protein [Chitinophagaceae bacterium]
MQSMEHKNYGAPAWLTTPLLLRLTKAVCVGAIGLLAALIAFGNLTDYGSNYAFVSHVLAMDTTFPASQVHYRSIHSPWVYHTAYGVIILAEAAMAGCCLRGSWDLVRALRAGAAAFHQAKRWGVAGILLGILIWFVGFEVIGGEWFAMWQSASWNGLGAAERVLSFLMLTLILLHLPESDNQPSN